MRYLKQQQAFTIIELLVVIIITAILIIWSMNINLSRLSTRQQVWIEITQLIALIETVKNNSQSGKAVWGNIEIPDLWEIEISMNNGGEFYSTAEIWGVMINDSQSKWKSTWSRQIVSLECHNFDSSNISSLTGTGTIRFERDRISLSNVNCGPSQKVLYVSYGYDNILQDFHFNSLSWVIEKN